MQHKDMSAHSSYVHVYYVNICTTYIILEECISDATLVNSRSNKQFTVCFSQINTHLCALSNAFLVNKLTPSIPERITNTKYNTI